MGEYSQVKFIRLNQRTSGFITSSDKGSVSILPLDIRDREVEQMSTHFSSITNMAVSPDNKLLFTAGNDGALFVYSIQDQLMNVKDGSLRPSIVTDDANDKKGGNKDPRAKIVDPDLADIVFVKKDQMDEWQESQSQLKYQLALTKKRIEIKLADQKKKFRRQFMEIEKQKDLDIRDLQKRFADLKKQKSLQDRQNFLAMQKMEENHLNAVEETQELYDKKLKDQDSDYLNLEQEKLEMIKYYEQKIKDKTAE